MKTEHRSMGIDQSLAASGQSGLCHRISHEDGTVTRTCSSYSPPKSCDGDDRLRLFRWWLLNELSTFKPDVLVIEDAPASIGTGKFGASASKDKLQQLLGVAICLANEWAHSHKDFRYYIVNVTHVKMFATGSGNGEKRDIWAWAEKLAPGAATNTDESDALCLAEIGAVVAQDAIALDIHQLVVASHVRGDSDYKKLKHDRELQIGKEKRAAAKANGVVKPTVKRPRKVRQLDLFVAPTGERVFTGPGPRAAGELI